MQNRRKFIKTIGAFGTGLSLVGFSPITFPISERRKITINGKRVTTVDLHAHCAWPQVRDKLRDKEVPDDKVFSELIIGPNRIEEMNARGIDIQVLSINEFWYEADQNSAEAIVKERDKLLSDWVKKHPDRFVALSTVPMQFPELAASHLEYAIKEIGLKGAILGGHVLGERLSSEILSILAES